MTDLDDLCTDRPSDRFDHHMERLEGRDRMPPRMSRDNLVQAVGRHVVDYFLTTRECLICDVDADDVDASGHRPWCPVGHVVATTKGPTP